MVVSAIASTPQIIKNQPHPPVFCIFTGG
ncbi:excisionase, partial [Shigella flexneri]